MPHVILPDGSFSETTIDAIDANLCGQINIAAPGTEVQGPNVTNVGGFLVIGHPSNTNLVWVMAHGLTKANGFPVSNSVAIPLNVWNLNQCDFDAEVAGEDICWIKL